MLNLVFKGVICMEDVIYVIVWVFKWLAIIILFLALAIILRKLPYWIKKIIANIRNRHK